MSHINDQTKHKLLLVSFTIQTQNVFLPTLCLHLPSVGACLHQNSLHHNYSTVMCWYLFAVMLRWSLFSIIVDVDECLSSPCQHNSMCEDQENSFLCHCTQGYTGIMCEIGMFGLRRAICSALYYIRISLSSSIKQWLLTIWPKRWWLRTENQGLKCCVTHSSSIHSWGLGSSFFSYLEDRAHQRFGAKRIASKVCTILRQIRHFLMKSHESKFGDYTNLKLQWKTIVVVAVEAAAGGGGEGDNFKWWWWLKGSRMVRRNSTL